MKRTFLSTLAVAMLIPATPSTANTYDVYSCWAGAETFRNPNASSVAWARDQSAAGGHFTSSEDCGFNPSSGAMSVISLGGYLANLGEYARLKFTAPTGSTVSRLQLWRNAWSYGTGTGAGAQRNDVRVLAAGATVPGGTDADGSIDVAYGTRGTANTTGHGITPANLLALNTSSLGSNSIEYRVGCPSSTGCPTASASAPSPNHFASGVDVYGAVVTVADSRSPSVVVADGGLFSNETASGVLPVILNTASDESGIKRLEIHVDFDPAPIAVLDFETDVNRCDWTKPAPCQNFTNAEIPVDTRQLSNGDHSFVVKAFDAADNEKASSTHYATIENATPVDPTPTDPTPTDPSPAGPGDPGANGPVGSPNGISPTGNEPVTGPSLTVQFDKNRKSTLNAMYGRMVTVRGHLVDGTGGAIAEAQIDYSALGTRAGARVQNLGSVRTDATGTFTIAVATKLGSRQLRFAYRPQVGGDVAVSAQAQLNVIAPVSLRIAPRHVRNRHRVTFSGRLAAGPIPRKGKLVNLQVVVDGHWHTFATVRTAKNGRFKYRYRFSRTYGRVTYRFRALSRYEAAYPFIAGHSRTVRVRVN